MCNKTKKTEEQLPKHNNKMALSTDMTSQIESISVIQDFWIKPFDLKACQAVHAF